MIAKENRLEDVLRKLNSEGYTLDFNPPKGAATSWGIHSPFPSELEFEIQEIIECYKEDEGEKTFITAFAVQTKSFGLKGIILRISQQEKYWTLEEIYNKFLALWTSIKMHFNWKN